MSNVTSDKEARQRMQRQLFIIVGITAAIGAVMLGLSLSDVFLPRRVWKALAGLVVVDLLMFPLLALANKQAERAAAEAEVKEAQRREREGRPRQFR